MKDKSILLIAILVIVESYILMSAKKTGIFNVDRIVPVASEAAMDMRNTGVVKSKQAKYTLEQYLEKSKQAYWSDGYIEAMKIIREAKSYYDDSELQRYGQLFMSAEPKALSTIRIMSSHCCNTSSHIREDGYGNSYSDAVALTTMNVYDSPNRSYVTLALNNDYSKMNLKFFNASSNEKSEVILRVIADGVCIYETERIKPMDGAIQIDLDVNNVKALELCAYHIKGTGGGLGVLGDGFVWRELTNEDF